MTLLAEKLKEIKPDLAGISSFSVALVDIVKVAQLIKEIKPEAHICMGDTTLWYSLKKLLNLKT
ncbi:hypothetical protein MASR1M68_12530 [Elusimicrobiota bacterium]